MRRKWRIIAVATTLMLIAFVTPQCWNASTPIPLETATWHAPKPISDGWAICDLDNDGNEEIVTEDGWHLWLDGNCWRAEKVPLKKYECVHLYSEELKKALLVWGGDGLWLVWKQKGWRRQKLGGRDARRCLVRSE